VKLRVAFGFAAAGLAGGACSIPPTACAGLGAFGLEITVVDNLTGAPAAAGAALLTYDLDRGGVRVDSVAGVADTDVLRGANDRQGRYSVVVRKAGYRDWSKSDVTVHGGCPSIETVRLTARLAQP
jgi:predicted lipoprotein with Yx(FWY)xxD motif